MLFYLIAYMLPFAPFIGILYYFSKVGDYHFRIQEIKREVDRDYDSVLPAWADEEITALKKEQWKCVGAISILVALSAFFTYILLPPM